MSATGTPAPVVQAEPAAQFTGRVAYVLSQLYYYLVAIVAVGFVIGGAIAALIALRELSFPSAGAVTRSSVRSLLQGLAFAVPGAISAWGHLAQATSREGLVAAPGAFWGRSLYFHGVAFMAYPVALGGLVAILFSLVNLALLPECPIVVGGEFCTDTQFELRSAANGAIVVLVAGAVWWWHLREGRRVVATEERAGAPMEGR